MRRCCGAETAFPNGHIPAARKEFARPAGLPPKVVYGDMEKGKDNEALNRIGRGAGLFRTLTEKSVAGIYVVQDGKFCFITEKAAAYAGYSVRELIGRKSDCVVHPEDRKAVKLKARAMLRSDSNSPHEFRIITKSGAVRWVMETVAAISFQGRPAILGNSMDVTERRRAEEALRESEEKYRSVVDHIGIGITVVSPAMKIITVNNQMLKWFPGIVNLAGNPYCYEVLSDPPRREICPFCPVVKTFADGNVHEAVTDTPLRGEVRHFRSTSSPLKDRDGKIIAAIEMVDDITERRRVDAQLKESEKWYRTLFETTGAATMLLEEDTTISFVNREFEKKFGYSKEEIENKRSWTEFIVPEDVGRMIEHHRQRRIDANIPPRNYEFRFLTKAGEARNIFITVDMIPGTTKSITSLIDITELKRTEEALHKRGKELENKTHELEELNAALRVLLKKREEDKNELEEKVVANLENLVLPYIEKLKHSQLGPCDKTNVNIIESNLKDIITPFSHNLSSRHLNLTTRELQIANLIKSGKTTKEIAGFLNVSPSAVNICRYRIRNKLGLNNKKVNLQSYLARLG